MPLPFIASAISRRDGSAADGIHLLWTAPPRIGYSIDGFDIQRRESKRREIVCYTLSPAELQTLHQTFRVNVPPGQVAFRRTVCPQFPPKPPDEPAPGGGGEPSPTCTDFRRQKTGEGPNPRQEKTGAYLVRGANGQAMAQTSIKTVGPHTALDCGFRLEIRLGAPASEVELTLVRFADPARVEAFDAAGAPAGAATMSSPAGQPETIYLSGAIQRIVVESKQDETLLLQLCVSQKKRCVEFQGRPVQQGPNPLHEDPFTLTVRGSTSQPATATRITQSGGLSGLECGQTLEIDVASPADTVEITLVHFARPARVDALRADGSIAQSAVMQAAGGQPETLVMGGGGIRRVRITAPQGETLLLRVCAAEAALPGSQRTCVDFRRQPAGAGRSPRTEGEFVFSMKEANGPARTSQIASVGGQTGLLCPQSVDVKLPDGVAAAELTLVFFGAAPSISAVEDDGKRIPAPALTGHPGEPQVVRLEGRAIRTVSITGGERTLLLQFCTERKRSVPTEGRRASFPQPAFDLHPSSANLLAAVAPGQDGCVLYDIRLGQPHYTVRVTAGLPGMLAIAMREGKAVDTRFVSAAGGTQTALFENRVVDQVLIYAGRPATSLVICTDVINPKTDEQSWVNVPFIAKNVHLPVRNVNPAMASVAAERALASSRLLPGETFDAGQFDQVAALMNDTAANSAAVSPMVQFVLTREKVADPFIEVRGWPYAFAMLMEADWRRMLGFGFLDRASGLTAGAIYDYRITGRFRRRELFERLLGFHTIPLGTTLPQWFHLGPVLVETPLPSEVVMFPKAPDGALRAAGRKGIVLSPNGPGGRSMQLSFADPVDQVVLEIEPGQSVGLHFEAKTTDYFLGLSGSLFSGPVPAAIRAELHFAEPVDRVTIFGAGLFYGLRVPPEVSAGKPNDVIPVSVVIPGVRFQSTPAPDPPLFLGTLNLQQPPLPGDPAVTTQQPPQNLGFHLYWMPPPTSGSAVVPWPPDLAAFPPFDVAGFNLERRRVDTAGPFLDVDDATPPTKYFGNRAGRRDPPQLYPGIDLTVVFPEAVQPEPPVSVLMDAEDTLTSRAKPAGPPPGSLHQYRIFSVDAIGRHSTTAAVGSVVRLEKRIPPPQPVGPTTPPPAGVQRPVGVSVRVLQSLDTRLTPSDRTLLGANTNAIVLEWAWTQGERDRDPYATEFRVYFRGVPPDLVRGSLTGVATPSGIQWQMAASLNQAIAADALKGSYLLTSSGSFKVATNTAGQNITIRFERSAIDPAVVPLAAAIEFPLSPDASELRPEHWPERTAIVPLTAQENYQFVFRDRLTISATQAAARVWVGVSTADSQAYIPDAVPGGPNGGRPGNESTIVAMAANAHYLGRPTLVAPPPLAAVPEQVTNEPVNDAVSVRLNLPVLLPAVVVPAGFKVKLERLDSSELLNRMSALVNNTIGARLPDGTNPTYTLANAGDQTALLAQIRTGEGVRVEGRFIMDFLTRHLVALEPLWQASSQALPVAFAGVDDALPGKAERYIHRIRLVDQAGHVSAGAAIAPQFVRVPTLASPGAPSFEMPGSKTNSLTVTARVRDVFDVRWLVLFMLSADATTPADDASLEKPQLLRLPNRRDLYPNNGVRLRLANGTLLAPAQAVEVSTGTADAPDRVLNVPIAAGFGKRVSVWAIAMTRDGITSRLIGPRTAFTGAAPLVVPALNVTAAAGADLATWGAVSSDAETALERSTDAGVTWTRVTPWIRPAQTSVTVPAVAGGRLYRLRLQASQQRQAVGAGVAPV